MRVIFWIIFLGIIGLLFSYLVYYFYILNKVSNENTDNIIIEKDFIDFDSLTLKQKIAQMIFVSDNGNLDLTEQNIGGIFLTKQKEREKCRQRILDYQNKSKIRLFISADMEGAWSPFEFVGFPSFSEIKNREEAYNIGREQGGLLKQIGFNLNFAPVAEYSDSVYGGRAFTGTDREVEEKLEGYITGLQESVSGICKHYPGKGMIKNLHFRKDRQKIEKRDLNLFEVCFKNNISGVMVGHQIVE
jgi:beta-N-acetylhexosaminidase